MKRVKTEAGWAPGAAAAGAAELKPEPKAEPKAAEEEAVGWEDVGGAAQQAQQQTVGAANDHEEFAWEDAVPGAEGGGGPGAGAGAVGAPPAVLDDEDFAWEDA